MAITISIIAIIISVFTIVFVMRWTRGGNIRFDNQKKVSSDLQGKMNKGDRALSSRISRIQNSANKSHLNLESKVDRIVKKLEKTIGFPTGKSE